MNEKLIKKGEKKKTYFLRGIKYIKIIMNMM